MNKVILLGHVGKDPDLKNLQSGSRVVKFSLATSANRKGQDGERIEETDWHNITAWDGLADTIYKYVKKGSMIVIEGKVKYRTYDTPDGETKYFTEIVADRMEFAGKKEEPVQQAQTSSQSMARTPVAGSDKVRVESMSSIADLPGNVADYDNIPEDNPDDLPF